AVAVEHRARLGSGGWHRSLRRKGARRTETDGAQQRRESGNPGAPTHHLRALRLCSALFSSEPQPSEVNLRADLEKARLHDALRRLPDGEAAVQLRDRV